MAVRGGSEIGKATSVIKTHTAAASGNPAGHGAAGCSATFYPATDMRGSSAGLCNYELHGTFVGTVVVDMTFDDAVTWFAAKDTLGNALSQIGGTPGRQVFREHEQGVGYRTRCTAFTSGSGVSRLSQ